MLQCSLSSRGRPVAHARQRRCTPIQHHHLWLSVDSPHGHSLFAMTDPSAARCLFTPQRQRSAICLFAPKGRGRVATGGAKPATSRAQRNPWKARCALTAPAGAAEVLPERELFSTARRAHPVVPLPPHLPRHLQHSRYELCNRNDCATSRFNRSRLATPQWRIHTQPHVCRQCRNLLLPTAPSQIGIER